MSIVSQCIKKLMSENITLRTTRFIDEVDRSLPEFSFVHTTYEDLISTAKNYSKTSRNVTLAVASVLNAVMTQRRVVFCITRDTISKLVEEDRNWPKDVKPSINSYNYEDFFFVMCNCGIFECVRSSKNRPSVFRLVKPEILELIVVDIDRQMKEALEFSEVRESKKSDEKSDRESDEKSDRKSDVEEELDADAARIYANASIKKTNSSSRKGHENPSLGSKRIVCTAGHDALHHKDQESVNLFRSVLRRAKSVDQALDEVLSLYQDDTPGPIEGVMMDLVRERFGDGFGNNIVLEYESKIPYRLSQIRKDRKKDEVDPYVADCNDINKILKRHLEFVSRNGDAP